MSMSLHSSKDQQRKVIRGKQSFHLLSEALACTQCNVELTILNMNLLCVSLQIQKSQSRYKRWFCDFIFSALDCKVEARWIRVVSNSATIVGKTRRRCRRSILFKLAVLSFCFYACKTCFKRLCQQVEHQSNGPGFFLAHCNMNCACSRACFCNSNSFVLCLSDPSLIIGIPCH